MTEAEETLSTISQLVSSLNAASNNVILSQVCRSFAHNIDDSKIQKILNSCLIILEDWKTSEEQHAPLKIVVCTFFVASLMGRCDGQPWFDWSSDFLLHFHRTNSSSVQQMESGVCEIITSLMSHDTSIFQRVIQQVIEKLASLFGEGEECFWRGALRLCARVVASYNGNDVLVEHIKLLELIPELLREGGYVRSRVTFEVLKPLLDNVMSGSRSNFEERTKISITKCWYTIADLLAGTDDSDLGDGVSILIQMYDVFLKKNGVIVDFRKSACFWKGMQRGLLLTTVAVAKRCTHMIHRVLLDPDVSSDSMEWSEYFKMPSTREGLDFLKSKFSLFFEMMESLTHASPHLIEPLLPQIQTLMYRNDGDDEQYLHFSWISLIFQKAGMSPNFMVQRMLLTTLLRLPLNLYSNAIPLSFVVGELLDEVSNLRLYICAQHDGISNFGPEILRFYVRYFSLLPRTAKAEFMQSYLKRLTNHRYPRLVVSHLLAVLCYTDSLDFIDDEQLTVIRTIMDVHIPHQPSWLEQRLCEMVLRIVMRNICFERVSPPALLMFLSRLHDSVWTSMSEEGRNEMSKWMGHFTFRFNGPTNRLRFQNAICVYCLCESFRRDCCGSPIPTSLTLGRLLSLLDVEDAFLILSSLCEEMQGVNTNLYKDSERVCRTLLLITGAMQEQTLLEIILTKDSSTFQTILSEVTAFLSKETESSLDHLNLFNMKEECSRRLFIQAGSMKPFSLHYEKILMRTTEVMLRHSGSDDSASTRLLYAIKCFALCASVSRKNTTLEKLFRKNVHLKELVVGLIYKDTTSLKWNNIPESCTRSDLFSQFLESKWFALVCCADALSHMELGNEFWYKFHSACVNEMEISTYRMGCWIMECMRSVMGALLSTGSDEDLICSMYRECVSAARVSIQDIDEKDRSAAFTSFTSLVLDNKFLAERALHKDIGFALEYLVEISKVFPSCAVAIFHSLQAFFISCPMLSSSFVGIIVDLCVGILSSSRKEDVILSRLRALLNHVLSHQSLCTFTPLIVREVGLVKAMWLSFLNQLSRHCAAEPDRYTDILMEIVDALSAKISSKSERPNDPVSARFLMKTSAVQALSAIALAKCSVVNNSILNVCWELFERRLMPSVRIQLEQLLGFIYVCHEENVDILMQKIGLYDMMPQAAVSIISVGTQMLQMCDSGLLCNAEFGEKIVDSIIGFSGSIHNLVRLSAHISLDIIHSELDTKDCYLSTGTVGVLREISRFSEVNAKFRKLMSLHRGQFLSRVKEIMSFGRICSLRCCDVDTPLAESVLPEEMRIATDPANVISEFTASNLFQKDYLIERIISDFYVVSEDSVDFGGVDYDSFAEYGPSAQEYDVVCHPEQEIVTVRKTAEKLQRKISPWANESLEVELFGRFGETERQEIIVCASLVEKVTNLGGITRTCEVFRAAKLVLHDQNVLRNDEYKGLSVSAEFWLPTEIVPLNTVASWLQQKKDEGFSVVGAEQASDSIPLNKFDFPKKTILLLGNEKEGISVELMQLLDYCVEIPQLGVIRSLNVHVTASLFLWEYTRKFLS